MNQQQTNWKSDQYSEISGIQNKANLELLGQLPLKETDDVLDAGCGDGKLTFWVAKEVAKGSVLGIDSSPSMIRLCREKLKVNPVPASFLVMNLADMDFESRFDLVFSNSVLHWVKKTDQALEGLYKSLKPGGSLGLQFPLLNVLHPFTATCEQTVRNLKLEKFFEDWEFPWYVPAPEEFKQIFSRYGFQETKVYVKSPAIDFGSSAKLFKSFDAAGLDLYTQRLPDAMQERFKQEVFSEVEKMKENGRLRVRFERIYAFGYRKI